MKKLSENVGNCQKVLFLGFNQEKTNLIDFLISVGCEVWHTEDEITDSTDFDIAISFGYRHIITRDVLQNENCLFINLHVSYLPFNRGSDPNFWAFYDNTPSGVTIHLIDAGIDTGDIICQKRVIFDQGESTFTQTYSRLNSEIEEMFQEWWDAIASRAFVPIPQILESGTFHRDSDLPNELSTWDVDIGTEITRLQKLAGCG